MQSPDGKVGVLIIGGGIIGLSIAYYLSKMNYSDVQILERDAEITMHASGHNAGGIAGVRDDEPPEARPLFRASMELFDELVYKEHFEFEYEKNGTISLIRQEQLREVEKDVNEFRGGSDSKIILLGPSELREMEPNLSTKYDHGVFYPDDAQGNSKKLGQCFAGEIAKNGASITTSSEVLAIETDGRKISKVKTNSGTLRPETVVISAGPWSRLIGEMIPGLDISVRPVKGHLITTVSPGKRILHSFIDGPNYYVVQTQNGNLVIGGGEDETGFDVRPDERRLSEAWAEGSALVPSIEMLNQESRSACLRPFSPRGVPIIGRTEKYENLLIATGHFKHGFALAPATGKLVAQLALNEKTEIDLVPFSPDRFIP